METRVTFRASAETVKRLRDLAEKYGMSQSDLLSALVHERWIQEMPKAQAVPKPDVRSDMEGGRDLKWEMGVVGQGQIPKKHKRHRHK